MAPRGWASDSPETHGMHDYRPTWNWHFLGMKEGRMGTGSQLTVFTILSNPSEGRYF